MKCPKCGYLGFETSERCRNCGYDFSLSVQTAPTTELPLQQRDGSGAPLEDLELGNRENAPALDLDRLIGTDTEEAPSADEMRASATPRRATPRLRRAAPLAPREDAPADEALPLFSAGASEPLDEPPLVAPPRPVGPPLSVRRTTPDIPRGRNRGAKIVRREEPGPELQWEAPNLVDAEEQATEPVAGSTASLRTDPAGILARVTAMLIDLVLLGGIDVTVVYLTLAIAGLTMQDISVLPPVPLAAFLLLLDGGYLAAFTAAGGQTLGKMVTGIRVVGDDGQRVDAAGAVLRAVGCGLSLLTVGIGYLPSLFTADRRALQDRLAGTRVVSASSPSE